MAISFLLGIRPLTNRAHENNINCHRTGGYKIKMYMNIYRCSGLYNHLYWNSICHKMFIGSNGANFDLKTCTLSRAKVVKSPGTHHVFSSDVQCNLLGAHVQTELVCHTHSKTQNFCDG